MKVSFWIYIFVLIFAPLAFASVELWSITVVEVSTCIAALCFYFSRVFYKKELVAVPGMLPLCLLLLFMLIQLVPLPVSLVKFLSPATFDAYEPVLQLNGARWIPLSIHQHSTLQEFMRIACYAIFYVLTVQLLSINDHLKKAVLVAIWLAAAIGLLAIIQRVGSPDKIYWLRSVPDNASPFGPWINPNQFAGFMEMIGPIALGLFLFYKPRFQPDETLRYKIVNFFSMPTSNLYMLLGFATSLIIMSVFVSLCRGGILTIIMALFVFMLLYNIKRMKQGRAAILGITGCVIVAVSWFGWDTVLAEFNTGIDAEGVLTDGRFFIWNDTLRIIQSFLLFGSGFGTFIDIFPSFMTFPNFHIIDHAHNDYLELLTDGGIIGFGLTGWFVLTVMLRGWKMIWARRDNYSIMIGIGALTGIIATLIHSITDFNMHNGAVGLYFFSCCGVLIAATNIRFVYPETQTLLADHPPGKGKYFLVITSLITTVMAVVQLSNLRAQSLFNETTSIYITKKLDPVVQLDLKANLQRAIDYSPLNYRYTYDLGSIENFFENREEATELLIRSARQNPMYGSTLQGIGLLLNDPTQSAKLLEKGYQRGLDDDELALNYIDYLLKNNSREKAIEIMSTKLEKTPALLPMMSILFDDYQFSQEQSSRVFGDNIEHYIGYGTILEKQEKFEDAEVYYSSALSLLDGEHIVKASWFQKLIRFYKKIDRPDATVAIIRQAVTALPENISFHLQLGDYYRKEGIDFRAQEEYERVLILQPGNRSATKRLRQMGLMDSY